MFTKIVAFIGLVIVLRMLFRSIMKDFFGGTRPPKQQKRRDDIIEMSEDDDGSFTLKK